MKKLGNKGQVLIETLVTSVMIVGVLVYLFIQLRNVNTNYSKTSHYNSINALYAADNYRTFIMGKEEHYSLQDYPSDGTVAYFGAQLAAQGANFLYYIDLTSCSSSFGIVNVSYCQELESDLKIKQVIMTKEDTTSLVQKIDDGKISDDQINANFKAFIKAQKVDKNDGIYRIFIETTDNDYASIKLK